MTLFKNGVDLVVSRNIYPVRAGGGVTSFEGMRGMGFIKDV